MFGLRSARLRLRSPASNVTVTLFPMVHLAEPAFYEMVFKEAYQQDAVLVEGVRSRVTTRITRVYRWIAGSKRLALAMQPKGPAQEMSRAQIIHADLSGEEFEFWWRKVSLFRRVSLYAAAPLYALYFRWRGTRSFLAKNLALDDLPSRDETLRWTPENATYTAALLTARDAKLVSHLRAFLDEPNTSPRTLAIVYGALHMRAVILELTRQRGFSAFESDWMPVFNTD